MKRLLIFLALVVVLVGSGFAFFNFYSYIFARKVEGEIVGVDRVSAPVAVMGTGAPIPNQQLFSFAVAIRENSGEIVTASSEDRQWAVASAGKCAIARFYPYPPWQLDKAGTYFGARLLRLSECAPGKPAQ